VGFDEGVRKKERKGRKAGWMKGLKGEWEVRTRAQTTKRQNEQEAKFPGITASP
jgi:predicted transposase YdaD